jgi:hypothetical protein
LNKACELEPFSFNETGCVRDKLRQCLPAFKAYYDKVKLLYSLKPRRS